MANANWSNPTLTSTYTNFVSEVKNRDEDLALQFDGTTSTNIPTNTIRWDSSANRWKKWNGTVWAELTSTYALTGLSTTGAASIGTTLGVTGTITGSSTVTGTALIPSGSTVPTNGIYLPVANNVAISTNGSGRLFVDSSGNIGIGSSGNLSKLTVNSGNNLSSSTLVAFNTQNTNINGLTISNWTGSATTYGPRIQFDNSGRGSFLVGGSDGANNFDICRTWGTPDLRIDSSGRLLVGTSSARVIEPYGLGTDGQTAHTYESVGDSAPGPGIALGSSSVTDRFGPYLYLFRSRGGSVGSNTSVSSGDNLGTISFAGADGTDVRTRGAAIYCEVDGTPGANDMPGRLVFSTTADGASSPTERLRIDSSGRVGIGTTSPDNTLSLGLVGSIDQDVNSVYIGNNFTSTGGNFKKTGNYAQQLMFDTATGNLIYKASASTGTAGNAITFSERFRIAQNGAWGLAGANYGSSSQVLTSNGSGSAPTWQNAPAPAALSTASGSAPSYSARAWVNFNGTGTVAIRASGNVSSITDNGVGNYTVNFTTAMADANYAVTGFATDDNNTGDPMVVNRWTTDTYTTSAVQIRTAQGAGGTADSQTTGISVFR